MTLTTETIAGRLRRRTNDATDPERSGLTSEDPATYSRTTTRSRHRGWGRRYARLLFVVDVAALLLASAVVHIVRFPSAGYDGSVNGYLPYVALTAPLVVSWLLALNWFDSRDTKTIGYGSVEYKRIIHATFAVFGLVAIVSYLLALELPRSYLLVMLPVGLAALLLARYACRRWLRAKRSQHKYLSKVLAIGDISTVTELVRDLSRTPQAGYQVIGVCIGQPPIGPQVDSSRVLEINGVPVLGGFDNIAEIATDSGADTVAVTSTASFGPSRVRQLSWELEDTNADLILAPALANVASPRIRTQPIAGLPLIHVDRPTYRGANRIIKKSFDLVGAMVLLLILTPILLAAAVAIKATSKGPVFFTQDRVGLNGRVFRMIKFRSMVADAESRIDELRQQHRDAGNSVLFKLKNDPRITKVGRGLRRFSIDEIPQLFNVLKGEMSLVGPRPPLKSEVELYGAEARRRLLVKPGMTGMWQVSGRSNLTWEDTVSLDVYYVENWSITGDLVIIWKTARAVLSSAGAY